MKKKALVILWSILALLFIAYGFFIHSANSGTMFYYVWLITGLVFVLFALAAGFHWWSMLPKVLRGIFLGLFLIGGIFFLLVEGMILTGFGRKGRKEADYILVLGAQIREDGPSVVLKYRLDEAVTYLMQNDKTRCIVAGGQGENEPMTEAEGMKKYLLLQGIDEERIIKEEKSGNTKENIRFSKELMEEESSVAIVTNNFHLFRALKIAEKQGIQNCSGISADANPLYLPNNMLREFFGVIKDFMLGNL